MGAMFLSLEHGENDQWYSIADIFRHKKTNKVGFFELGCDVKSVTGWTDVRSRQKSSCLTQKTCTNKRQADNAFLIDVQHAVYFLLA